MPMDDTNDEKLAADRALIARYGGVSQLAERLGFTVQRVQNWTVRGIPSEVKVCWPEMFINVQPERSERV